MTQITKTKSKRKIVLFLVVVLTLSVISYQLSVRKAVAQQRLPLVVAPARQQTTLDPGEKESLIIKFFNESAVPISGTLKAVDFIVTGTEGKPILLENPSIAETSGKYSASSWIKLPYERAAIPAGTVLKVQFDINVPKDALPGGRYVALYFEQTGYNVGAGASPSLQSGEIAVTPRITGLINIRVSGPITESASIRRFSAPSFLEFGPVPVYTEIFNAGNYHITPQGQITMSDFMGRQISRVILEEKNVFPESSRIYETEIGSKLLFGKFKLTLAAAYGEYGQVLSRSIYVWVFPWKLTLAIVLGIAIIVLLGVKIWKSTKGKQKKLEAQLKEEISEIEELKEKYKDATSSPKP